MDLFLVELKCSSGEHNTYKAYMIHTNPHAGCVNMHLGIPLMYGFIILYIIYIYMCVFVYISCKNTFGVKKAWSSKVESYLEVNT